MQPTLIMMMGLPGSGKSTKAYELSCDYVCPVISSDAIRGELTGSEENMDKDNEVFKILHQRVKNNLLYGRSGFVIYDACNISYKKRMAFLNQLNKIDCHKVCYFVHTPYEKCLENNKKRAEDGGRFVPEYAIKNMYKNIYIPQYYEGWDEIIIDTKCNIPGKNALTELFYGDDGLCSISQDNPHHKLSIGDHCIACYLNTLDFGNKADANLHMAALLHDIGKQFTKGYKDSKGNPTETAHYYQHHLVSAYDAVKYLSHFSKDDMLEILALIQWHMFPYFWEKGNNEKMRKKYQSLWGNELYEKVMLLDKADQEAH